jgi:uncharacterized membrane protein
MKRFTRSLNPVGVVVGAPFLAASLTPSLLPRAALAQGLGSGVVFGIGYAVGVGLSALLAARIAWRPSARLLHVSRLIGWPVFAVVMIAGVIGGIAAQDEVRRMVELAPLDGVNVVGFVATLLLTSLACLAIGRGIRILYQRVAARLELKGIAAARAQRRALGGTALVILVALALLAAGFFVVLDRSFYATNGQPAAGLAAPDGTYRSGGTGSAVQFSELGAQGAAFVTGGPSAAQISDLTGIPAITPIRVYVGIAAGGTIAQRAATAVAELERTGAFERSFLMVAAATGTGWVEPQGVDSLEYLHHGDTASVALQFAYTPSFVTAMTAPQLPIETFSALFAAVRAKWLTLPAGNRPQLVVYGLSLGAQAVMGSFSGVEQLRELTDGALVVGPTNSTPLWRHLQDTRDAGSPPWQPVLNAGQEVRWASGFGDLDNLPGTWNPPRVAILQHSTDPVTWLGPELVWQRPEWLTDGYRAPDVSPHMQWIPVVTAVQVTLDMIASTAVPARHGHAFGDVMLDGWVGVTGAGGLDPAALARIQKVIESYWVIPPFQT